MTSELRLAQSSGFPLQLAIESAVSEGTELHGWRVSSHEHPWSKGDDSGFADLVLDRSCNDIVRMVVECKKRKGELLFFCLKNSVATSRCRVLWGYRQQEEKHEGGWVDVNISPPSLESEFCVVNGEGSEKRTPLLEAAAFDVTRAAEGICTEELALAEKEPMGSALVYVPVIVTTARLLVCKMDPQSVSLTDGELKDADFDSVQFLRFRKSLAPQEPSPKEEYQSLGQSREYAARTVIIVSAESLDAFLRQWTISKRTERELPWVSLRRHIDQEDRARWMRRELNQE